MKKIIILLIFICIYSVRATDTTGVKYFPLTVGNIYVFKNVSYPPSITNYSKAVILKDSLFNSHKYYFINNFCLGSDWYRIDSTTGCVWKFDSTSSCHPYLKEDKIDSLPTDLGQGSYHCAGGTLWLCDGIHNITIFNTQTIEKTFYTYFPQGFITENTYYLRNFGVYFTSFSGRYYSQSSTLMGCIIDGVLYGDTSLYVGILNKPNDVISNYSLLQNYPNPFNPTTKIKFDLPKSSFTKLVIYDILGHEVVTLVNEELKPGSYESVWDGSNFASGVYFYKLQTESFSQTKRMVLIK